VQPHPRSSRYGTTGPIDQWKARFQLRRTYYKQSACVTLASLAYDKRRDDGQSETQLRLTKTKRARFSRQSQYPATATSPMHFANCQPVDSCQDGTGGGLGMGVCGASLQILFLTEGGGLAASS